MAFLPQLGIVIGRGEEKYYETILSGKASRGVSNFPSEQSSSGITNEDSNNSIIFFLAREKNI